MSTISNAKMYIDTSSVVSNNKMSVVSNNKSSIVSNNKMSVPKPTWIDNASLVSSNKLSVPKPSWIDNTSSVSNNKPFIETKSAVKSQIASSIDLPRYNKMRVDSTKIQAMPFSNTPINYPEYSPMPFSNTPINYPEYSPMPFSNTPINYPEYSPIPFSNTPINYQEYNPMPFGNVPINYPEYSPMPFGNTPISPRIYTNIPTDYNNFAVPRTINDCCYNFENKKIASIPIVNVTSLPPKHAKLDTNRTLPPKCSNTTKNSNSEIKQTQTYEAMVDECRNTYSKLIILNPDIVLTIPENIITQSLCEIALSIDGLLFDKLPKRYQNKQTAMIAFKQNKNIFKILDDKFKSNEMYKELNDTETTKKINSTYNSNNNIGEENMETVDARNIKN